MINKTTRKYPINRFHQYNILIECHGVTLSLNVKICSNSITRETLKKNIYINHIHQIVVSRRCIELVYSLTISMTVP